MEGFYRLISKRVTEGSHSVTAVGHDSPGSHAGGCLTLGALKAAAAGFVVSAVGEGEAEGVGLAGQEQHLPSMVFACLRRRR